VTALIALVPFGAPLIWLSAAIWLLITDRTGAGIFLLVWGTLPVSWVDNLIRPLVISNQTRIPFLLVLFGVLGGIAAFGLVGLFMGPVILAVLMPCGANGSASRIPPHGQPPGRRPRSSKSSRCHERRAISRASRCVRRKRIRKSASRLRFR
jgi:predicted PurR-regulated permease PerM